MAHSSSLNVSQQLILIQPIMILNNNKKKEGIKANEKKLCYENRYNKAKSRIIHGQAGLLGLSSSRRLQRIITLSQREQIFRKCPVTHHNKQSNMKLSEKSIMDQIKHFSFSQQKIHCLMIILEILQLTTCLLKIPTDSIPNCFFL